MMNNIAQTWAKKISNKSRSPSCKRILSSEESNMASFVNCNSWGSRMLAKVKECRDAIKNMIAFDRLPHDRTRIIDQCFTDSSILTRATTSMSSMPDIITFNGIALKQDDNEDEPVPIRSSTFISKEATNSFIQQNDTVNDSINYQKSMNNSGSNSLQSFLELEKQIRDEFVNEDKAFSVKRKISAEPFLSYTEGNAEFVWNDETMEDSFSGKPWNSLEQLNSIEIGKPRRNSTFCEDSDLRKKNRTSSPVRNSVFHDSGFENYFGI